MRCVLLSLALTAALGAPNVRAAPPQSAPVNAVTDLASLLEGEFTTTKASSEAGTTTPRDSKPPIYELSKRVDVPGMGHNVVYSEMREGSQDGRLLRQRLYVLNADPATNSSRILMTTYDLGNAPGLAGAYANPAPLAKLNPPDLKPPPAGCEIAWHRTETGFDGDAPSRDCAKSGALVARLTVSKAGMTEGPPIVNPGGSGSSSEPPATLALRRLR